MISRHGPVLRALLPAPYETPAPELEVELDAAGLVLDGLDTRSDDLLGGILPNESIDLLPLWEEAYGLPETCDLEAVLTEEDRAVAVITKMSMYEAFSMPYLLSLAAELGFTGISIEPVHPTNCTDPCTYALYGPVHRSYLDVHIPLPPQAHSALECAFLRVQPADVIFRFHYEG